MNVRLSLCFGLISALVACGSGTGWPAAPSPTHRPTTAPSATASPSPTPTQGPLAVQSPAVQRAIASQAFASAFLTQRAFLYNSGNSFAPASVIRHDMLAATTPRTEPRGLRIRPDQGTPKSGYGPCSNGLEQATGSGTDYYQVFYDNACTTLYQVVTYGVSSDPPDTVINGCITDYATGGSVDGFETISFNADFTDTPNTSTLVIQPSTNESAAAMGTIGLACSGSGTLNCGDGFTDSLTSNSDIGGLAALPMTITNGTSSTVAIHGGSSVRYSGALDTLVLNTPAPAAFPTWTVSGGTSGTSTTINANLSFTTNGIVQTGSTVSGTDAADGGVFTMTSSATGFTGNIVQQGLTPVLTTFTLDLNGTGTITYSNLTQCPVVLWMPSC